MNKKQLLFKTLSMAVFAAVMLFNTSEVSAQVKIGSNPTVINAANNLEVESADPTKKVSVDKTTGKVTIADGSQGTNKILTSDVNGVATWQNTATLRIPQTMFTGYYSGGQTFATNSSNSATKISLNVINPAGTWVANSYTIPESGLYRVEFNGSLFNGVAGKTYYNQFITLVAGSVNQPVNIQTAYTGLGLANFITGYLTAGQTVSIVAYSYAPDAVTLLADVMTIQNASLIITKVE